MANRIKGITVEIGGDTTGLSKALSGVNKEIRDTQTQLNDVNRLLKLDPGNTELLRQKYELLNKSVESTEKKLEVLKQAEKQVQDQFKRGQVSEAQYNSLKREIIATESSLKKTKSEAQKTANEIRGIDEKPVEEVASAADKAETSLKDAGKEASNFGDYLKAEALVEGTKAIASGLKDIAEESREYMKIMGSLEVSSQAAGYTAEQTASSYKTLYGVLGDDQTAATTTANLQALGLSQTQLGQVINGTIGAWATHGDSIPIDSLSEAINETVKTGNVTGTFADVLNWAGTSEDAFNQKLQSASSESERANLVLQQLASQGLIDAGEAWQENNKALVENNQANADLQEQLATLGETVMPIITAVTQGLTNILSWFNNLSPEVKNFIGIVLGVVAAISVISGIIQGITAAQSALNLVMSMNPIMLIVTAIAALVAAFIYLWNTSEDFRNFWIELWQSVSEFFINIWNGICSFFTETIPNAWNGLMNEFNKIGAWWSNLWNGVSNTFSRIWNGLVDIAKAPINGIIGLLNGAINGINWIIDGINSISFTLPDWAGGYRLGFNIGKIGNIPYLAKGGILAQGSAVVGEAGPELLTMAGNRAIVQPLTNSTSNTTNLGGVNIMVYGAPGQNVNELADIVMDRMETVYQMKGAVWA